MNQSLRKLVRVLTFRATREELLSLNTSDLILGLILTWLVGIGRTWDNPRVGLLQASGIGSVIYILCLATAFYIIVAPLAPKDWSWKRLLTFISFTSPPGFLYAIPVQMIFTDPRMETANEINVGFLGIVSIWRVALLMFYLKRLAQLPMPKVLVSTVTPICGLVVILVLLNLDRVVFLETMSGIHATEASPNDDIYFALRFTALVALFAFLPLLIAYLIAIFVTQWSPATIPDPRPPKQYDPTRHLPEATPSAQNTPAPTNDEDATGENL